MRHFITLGLCLCAIVPAAAQGGEIIIRRPGMQDRVIRLDSTASREELAKLQTQMREMTTTLQQRTKELQNKVTQLDLAPLRTQTLALKEGFSQNLLAPLMKSVELTTRRQPHLGIVVRTQASETDKFGAYIEAVTPGSPAEKAGIMSGDIITRIAGKSLAAKDAAKDDPNPGVRLISIIATLSVGKPTDVELRRGTQTVNVKVTPNDDGGVIARLAPSIAEIPRLPTDRIGGEMTLRATPAMPQYNVFSGGNSGFTFSFSNNGLFSNVELTALNEKLGSYFGATEGVLVVNTDVRRVFEEASVAMPRAAVGGGFGAGGARGGAVAGSRMADSTMAAGRGGRGGAMGRSDSVARAMGRMDSVRRIYIDGVPASGKPVNIGLEPGDVIVSVDGRKVTSPSQLLRIVGTYDHNDEFKLQIMRQKRAETLTVKVP